MKRIGSLEDQTSGSCFSGRVSVVMVAQHKSVARIYLGSSKRGRFGLYLGSRRIAP